MADLSDFENKMAEYSAEDLEIERAEREAIMFEATDESVDGKEVKKEEALRDVQAKEYDAFMSQLERARELLEEKGKLAGLCYYCGGSKYLRIENEEGYTGLQYKIDNEIPKLIPCTHGRDLTETFDF